MESLFSWIENSPVSTAIRKSDSILAIPTLLVLHTIGMGFVAGTSAAIDLRILGVAKRVPLRPMERFLPVLWLGVAVNVASGLLLLISYPTKALTNPVFYAKLLCIALGLMLLQMIRSEVFRKSDDAGMPAISTKAKGLAAVSLCLWIAAIASGRLLAYTYKWEMVGIRAIL